MKSRIATTSDIDGVLALQGLNLYSELDHKEREKGFVTTPFTNNQIEEILRKSGLFVTEDNGRIIAYVFAGTWDFFEQWPIFPYMTSRFSDISFQNWNITTDTTFQYGPVCVDLNYRGKRIFNSVFEAMRLEWVKKFPLAVTFINAVNDVSVRAHSKLGWETIDRFQYNDKSYFTLAFDMKNSVV